MPIDSITDKYGEQVFKCLCDLHKMFKNNQYTRLDLGNFRVHKNTTSSPDGAMGYFLLVKREDHKIKFNHFMHSIENTLLNVLSIRSPNLEEIEALMNKPEFSKEYGKRKYIQNAFEYYTKILFMGQNIKIEKAKEMEQQNYYDFLVFIDGKEYGIEIKSDKWIHTGNLSLELIRDYRKDCDNITNVGSVLKSKADFWIEYYYDQKKGKIEIEVYKLKDLQTTVERFMEIIGCLNPKKGGPYGNQS
jgi:hypothetical protein